MLTSLTVRNFKSFRDVTIDLGSPVVFVGPNDSGKTTALQALALWGLGVRRWTEKWAGKEAPEKRVGVTINRRDPFFIPVPESNLLWRGLHVREARPGNGEHAAPNVLIEIVVEGVSDGRIWNCGMEFDYANAESFYCRPLRLGNQKNAGRMPVPKEAADIRVSFLPPMSGLSDREFVMQPGQINVLVGQGRTAEVLRNLAHLVVSGDGGDASWRRICERIKVLFGVDLQRPELKVESSELTMTYRGRSGPALDLSASGRGMQQTLLLLAHLATNPKTVLLLDEPDAHLEILRQRQIYSVLTESARESGSQAIFASHSEVVLNEAAGRDVVVAFLGRPHRINDRGSQLLKALRHIPFDHYYQAKQRGWVLYLEGSTDGAILRTFAETLGHEALRYLDEAFVWYVQNQPARARDHFFGLREAKPDLVGIAVFDRLVQPVQDAGGLKELMWSRREIENYFCTRKVLRQWVPAEAEQRLGGSVLTPRDWHTAMEEAIDEIETAAATLGMGSPWSPDTKVTDHFLNPLFRKFYQKVGLPPALTDKSDYHHLARLVPREEIDEEITRALDAIVAVAQSAKPASDVDDA